MSQPDFSALSQHFKNWHQDRVPLLPEDKAFERYCLVLTCFNSRIDLEQDLSLLSTG